jgi:hypothetical protein
MRDNARIHLETAQRFLPRALRAASRPTTPMGSRTASRCLPMGFVADGFGYGVRVIR